MASKTPRSRRFKTLTCSHVELDAEITKFINEHGRTMDKLQFDDEYPFEI
jgi:hypothetical protein